VTKKLYQQESKRGGKLLLLALRWEVGLKATKTKSAATTDDAVNTTTEI